MWAIALGLRDGGDCCLQSHEFARTSMEQARLDSRRFQGQDGVKLI